jgi:hypothetical protein
MQYDKAKKNMDTALNLRDIQKVKATDLPNIGFASTEVFTSADDMRVRVVSLDKAVIFSRNPSVKTLLVVNTQQGFRAVETPVFSLSLQSITINEGVTVPLHAVYSVNIE